MRRLMLPSVLVTALLVRLWGITYPLIDHHDWRQVDTASIAYNFLTQSFNIFRPQLFYDGPFPNVVQLELQITPFITAFLSKVVGFSDTLARLVPVLFAVVTVCFLFQLVKKWFDPFTAFVAGMLFSLMPMAVFFTRTVQPESSVLFFIVGALYWHDRWMSQGGKKNAILAALFTILVPLSKLTAIFVFLPLLHITYLKYRKNWRRYVPSILVFAVSLLLAAVYYKYMESVAEQTFVSGITQKHLIPEFFSLFTEPAARQFLYDSLIKEITTPIGLVFLIVGAGYVIAKRLHPVVLSWLLAALIYAGTVGAVIKYDYYMVLVTPIFGILIAIGIVALIRHWKKAGLVLAALSVAGMAFFSVNELRPMYWLDMPIYNMGMTVQKYTPKDSIILIGDYNPSLLYYAKRAGYRTPQQASEPADIEKFRQMGAQYFVPTHRFGMFDRTKNYLEQFKKLGTKEGYVFYDLTKKANE